MDHPQVQKFINTRHGWCELYHPSPPGIVMKLVAYASFWYGSITNVLTSLKLNRIKTTNKKMRPVAQEAVNEECPVLLKH